MASVQAYHIPTASLLPPLLAHPSPPTVLAISNDGRMLLSASPRPPTAYVHDLSSGRTVEVDAERTVNVNCAAFQHKRVNGHVMFMLGLKDGKVAVYRLSAPVTSIIPSETSRSTQHLLPAQISLPTRLHSAAMGGVCTAEFLPGDDSRIVSLGFDNRCRIADFKGANGAKVLRTWNVEGETTCLSISRCTASKESDKTQCLIAVGTRESGVSVFNMLGLLIHEIKMTEPIVSVQWVGDMSLNSGGQIPFQAGQVDDGAIMHVAPALVTPITPSLATEDLLFTPPTRTSSLRISRRPTRKRLRIRPSTFHPPTSPGRSTQTSTSLQEADPIPFEDGTETETQFFTPPSTQRLHSITSEFDTPFKGESKVPQIERRDCGSGSVYSSQTRMSSLPTPQSPTRRASEEKKSMDVARKRVGVHIRRQTETPEWLTPRPVLVPVLVPSSLPAPTRSPPPIPRISGSTSPAPTPTAASHERRNKQVIDESAETPDEDESKLVRLRQDHEHLKAQVSMLRSEVCEIKTLLSPQPQVD